MSITEAKLPEKAESSSRLHPPHTIISINDLGSGQNSRINFIFASTLEDILEFLDGFS